MNYTPYGNRILVKKVDVEDVISSGVKMTATVIPRGESAIVISKGEQCTHVEEGMSVIYAVGAAKPIFIDGKNYHTLLEHELWFYKDQESTEAKESTF